jgi:hypothetical protein
VGLGDALAQVARHHLVHDAGGGQHVDAPLGLRSVGRADQHHGQAKREAEARQVAQLADQSWGSHLTRNYRLPGGLTRPGTQEVEQQVAPGLEAVGNLGDFGQCGESAVQLVRLADGHRPAGCIGGEDQP